MAVGSTRIIVRGCVETRIRRRSRRAKSVDSLTQEASDDPSNSKHARLDQRRHLVLVLTHLAPRRVAKPAHPMMMTGRATEQRKQPKTASEQHIIGQFDTMLVSMAVLTTRHPIQLSVGRKVVMTMVAVVNKGVLDIVALGMQVLGAVALLGQRWFDRQSTFMTSLVTHVVIIVRAVISLSIQIVISRHA